MVKATTMEFTFDTRLDSRQLALTFRVGPQNPSWSRMLAAHGLEWDFFTPAVETTCSRFWRTAGLDIRRRGELRDSRAWRSMRITAFEGYPQAKSAGVLLQV